MKLIAALLASAASTVAFPANAADPRYPDWPCTQIKVPELSVAAVWEGPPIEGIGNTWQADAKVQDLVARLAARRTSLEEAQTAIAGFITGSPTEREGKATLLFAGLFETLNRQRAEVMNGIERFTRRQRELADRIRAGSRRLGELQTVTPRDENQISELAAQVEWDTRIFEDRRKSTRYVCEVPTIIERRLFALGRAIQQAAN